MYPIFAPSIHIHLSSYLLWMSATLSFCVFYFYNSAPKNSLSKWIAANTSLYALVGGFAGARLLHIVYEYPSYYFQYPMEILKFWNGGFVYYGGLFGGLLFSIIYLRSKKQSVWKWLDHSAPILSLGYALGRIGCFWAGCCYGKSCSLPWAVVYPPGVEAPPAIPLHPTQLYATLLEFLVYISLQIFKKRNTKLQTGHLFSIWIILHSIGRIINEHYRNDFRGESFLHLSISTHLSLALILSGFYFLLSTNHRTKN